MDQGSNMFSTTCRTFCIQPEEQHCLILHSLDNHTKLKSTPCVSQLAIGKQRIIDWTQAAAPVNPLTIHPESTFCELQLKLGAKQPTHQLTLICTSRFQASRSSRSRFTANQAVDKTAYDTDYRHRRLYNYLLLSQK